MIMNGKKFVSCYENIYVHIPTGEIVILSDLFQRSRVQQLEIAHK